MFVVVVVVDRATVSSGSQCLLLLLLLLTELRSVLVHNFCCCCCCCCWKSYGQYWFTVYIVVVVVDRATVSTGSQCILLLLLLLTELRSVLVHNVCCCCCCCWQSYGQYWPEENEECECGPFIIEAVSINKDHRDTTVRELKLTYSSDVGTCSTLPPFPYLHCPLTVLRISVTSLTRDILMNKNYIIDLFNLIFRIYVRRSMMQYRKLFTNYKEGGESIAQFAY